MEGDDKFANGQTSAVPTADCHSRIETHCHFGRSADGTACAEKTPLKGKMRVQVCQDSSLQAEFEHSTLDYYSPTSLRDKRSRPLQLGARATSSGDGNLLRYCLVHITSKLRSTVDSESWGNAEVLFVPDMTNGDLLYFFDIIRRCEEAPRQFSWRFHGYVFVRIFWKYSSRVDHFGF